MHINMSRPLKMAFASLFLSCTFLNASDENTLNFQPLYTFATTSVNYLDWSKGTQTRTSRSDFTFLELEGGAGWNFGEFYGYIDIENPTKDYEDAPPRELRFVTKPIVDIKLIDNLALHVQDYYFKSDTFYVNNLVLGFSYKYVSDFGLWIKPFIGSHYQNSTYYSGNNGTMAGWVLNYDMNILGEKCSLFQWHEMEFNRDKTHYQLNDGTPIGDGKSHGINGAVSLWWHVTPKFSTGVQYRYADHKLGFESYQSAMIYTFKYNL